MNKINFYLESRLAAVKKRAQGYAKHNPEGAYKSALEWQVKYGRKGWVKYDTANDYDESGNMRLYNLDHYDAVPCNELRPRYFDYTGYYCDSFQHDLIAHKVVRIKTGRGYFIAPATEHSEWDDAVIYLSEGRLCSNDINSDDYESAMMDAARRADSIAEREAERLREDDAKFQAEDQTDNLKAENKDARAQAHSLIQAIREQRKIGEIVTPICNALISEIKGLRREIQRNNERISALSNNYWLAVE